MYLIMSKVFNVDLTIDVDNDGLADTWDAENGLDNTSTLADNGTNGDSDGDLLANFDEFNNNSHPMKPTILFRKGWNLISWPSNPGPEETIDTQLNGVPRSGKVWTWYEDAQEMFIVQSGTRNENGSHKWILGLRCKRT